MVKEEVAVLIVLVCRHRRAVGAAVRRAVDDEVLFFTNQERGERYSSTVVRTIMGVPGAVKPQ